MLAILLTGAALAAPAHETWTSDQWDQAIAQGQSTLNGLEGDAQTLRQDVSALGDVFVADLEANADLSRHLATCSDLQVRTDQTTIAFWGYHDQLAPAWEWGVGAGDLTVGQSGSVWALMAQQSVVRDRLHQLELDLSATCGMVSLLNERFDDAQTWARRGMDLVPSAPDDALNADDALVGALTTAQALGMSELGQWVAVAEGACRDAYCLEVCQEIRAAQGSAPTGPAQPDPVVVDDDDDDDGIGKLVHRQVTVGWALFGQTHQLGLQGRTGIGPLAIRGGYVYGLDRSHGWNVKLGAEKWFGSQARFGIGVLGTIDAYGASHSNYTLDRTLGIEVPVGLRLLASPKLAFGVGATPRWNQQATRRSSELPSWLHELSARGDVSYALFNRLSLVVAYDWHRAGPTTLRGPSVGLRL